MCALRGGGGGGVHTSNAALYYRDKNINISINISDFFFLLPNDSLVNNII